MLVPLTTVLPVCPVVCVVVPEPVLVVEVTPPVPVVTPETAPPLREDPMRL